LAAILKQIIDACRKRLSKRLRLLTGRDNMDKAKRKELESKGWKVGSFQEFLGLSPEESAYIELKLRLGGSLKRYREGKTSRKTNWQRSWAQASRG
jgi:hypothetical protein